MDGISAAQAAATALIEAGAKVNPVLEGLMKLPGNQECADCDAVIT